MLKLLLFLFFITPGSWARDLSWLEEAYAVTQVLFREFPTRDYSYLTIGSSPTLVNILLELSSESRHSHHLPLSIPKFRGQWKELYYLEYGQKINLENYPDLNAHFKNFLPSLDQLSGKKLVLIDYISRGVTLHYLTPLIEQFYKSEVSLSIFGIKYVDDATDFTRTRNKHLLPLKHRYEVKLWEFDRDSIFGQALRDGDFDQLSPWLMKYPSGKAISVTANPKYSELKDSIKNAIIRPPMPLPKTSSRCFVSLNGLVKK
jgi:hypothetical protein